MLAGNDPDDSGLLRLVLCSKDWTAAGDSTRYCKMAVWTTSTSNIPGNVVMLGFAKAIEPV